MCHCEGARCLEFVGNFMIWLCLNLGVKFEFEFFKPLKYLYCVFKMFFVGFCGIIFTLKIINEYKFYIINKISQTKMIIKIEFRKLNSVSFLIWSNFAFFLTIWNMTICSILIEFSSTSRAFHIIILNWIMVRFILSFLNINFVYPSFVRI